MMKRQQYLEQLVTEKEDRLIKMITGIRGCGKTYLLFNIYHHYLNTIGIDDDHIIEIALDDEANAKYRNPIELEEYIRSKMKDKDKTYYLFLDEILNIETVENPYRAGSKDIIGFTTALLSLLQIDNLDIYATSSNARAVSIELPSRYRFSIKEIQMYPLTFSEFMDVYQGNEDEGFKEYSTYGGLPYVVLEKDHAKKEEYLKNLFSIIYQKEIMKWRNVKHKESLNDILEVFASTTGKQIGASQISQTINASGKTFISRSGVEIYSEEFKQAYLISHLIIFEILNERDICLPKKHYFADIGLRNAMLNFQLDEEEPIMEHIIYNNLLATGYTADIGSVRFTDRDENGKCLRLNLEIDFVASYLRRKKVCFQTLLSLDDEEKRIQAAAPYRHICDDYTKIVIVKDDIDPFTDEDGVRYAGIKTLLLKPGAVL